jgi:hypothetical protein
MQTYKVSYFNSSQRKIISDIRIYARDEEHAKITATNIIPCTTKLIMLILENSEIDKAIWHWIGCRGWYDNKGTLLT